MKPVALIKKITAVTLVFVSLCSNVIIFADEASGIVEPKKTYSELSEQVYSTSYQISDGLTYERNLSYHPSYGTEREYVLTYSPESVTDIAFVTSETLYKTDTVQTLAQNAYPDKNFVAGINADFFNLSTGVPESAYIKAGELYTTDRDSFCLAKREDGTFFIDKPQIKLSLTADKDEKEYTILHLNKEFSEYGLYLYNSRFSETTHIKNETTSVVLYAYSQTATYDELFEKYFDEHLQELLDKYDKVDSVSSRGKELRDEMRAYVEKMSGYRNIEGIYYLIEPLMPKIGNEQKLVVSEVRLSGINESVPEGAYLLCADSRSYGYILMAFEAGDTFSLKIDGNESFYNVENAVGTGTVIVKDSEVVDDRSFSHYLSAQPRSAVGIREDGSLVFFAVDGRQKGHSAGLKLIDLAERMKALGCVYAANLDGGGSTAVSVSMPGYDLASTVNKPSAGKERKVSNAIAFYNTLEKDAVPAKAYIYGDYYLTLSDTPITLGDIVLADQNGFSVIPDPEPSTQEKEDFATNIKDQEPLNNTSPETEQTGENTLHEEVPIGVEQEPKLDNILPENVSLYTKDSISTIENDTVNPNGYTGRIEVYSSLDGGITENLTATVMSLEEPDTIELSATQMVLAPFETCEITVSALYRGFHVASALDSFSWDIRLVKEQKETDDDIEPNEEDLTVDEDGAVTETEVTKDKGSDEEAPTEQEAFATFENGVFRLYENAAGKSFILSATRGETVGELLIKVEDYPFADMQRHWAEREIYSLAKEGIVKGEITEDGTAFYFPERRFSRNEFCVMLARLTDIGSEVDIPEINEDEEYSITELFGQPEWAFEAVYRLYNAGILQDILVEDPDGKIIFHGQEPITREEVISVVGKICEAAPEAFSLANAVDLTEEQKANDSIKNAIGAGIFSGFEDGTYRLSEELTRAQAAAVFVRLDNHLKKLNEGIFWA